MKKLLFPLCVLLFAAPLTHAQTAGKVDFQLKKVGVDFVPSPSFTVSGTQPQMPPPSIYKWMQMECDFDAKPEFTDELVFTYYVYLNKRLFVGSVSHVNIAKSGGTDLHSVMYISPKTVARIMGGHPVSMGEIYVTVQITKPGISLPLAEKSSKQVKSGWWAALKQETGFVVNKNETPFAPLWWDRYEAIKSTGQH